MIIESRKKYKKALLWGTKKECYLNYNLIKYYELKEEFRVYGITSNDFFYEKVGDYIFIKKSDIKKDNYDIVIILADVSLWEIYNEVLNMGFTEPSIILSRVLRIPGFCLNEYQKIKENTPTIISPICWGGMTYHSLCLRFNSPFINMFVEEDDYMKMLYNLDFYLEQELKLNCFGWQNSSRTEYPIAECGDILLHFNHYLSFDEAVEIWDRRKKRIKNNNMFVMMFTEKYKIAKDFCGLPFEKKICFTSFPVDHEALHQVKFRNKIRNVEFWKIINGMASGEYIYYNLLDLIGKGYVNTLF